MGGIALLLLSAAQVVPWRWAVSVAGGLFVLRWFTASCYLVDLPSGRVLYSFKCLGFRRLSVAFEPGEVAAVGVTGRRCHGNYGWVTWWEYRIEAVRQDGRRVPLTDWNQDCVAQVNTMATELAPLLGCNAIRCPEKRRLLVQRTGGRIEFSHGNWPFWRDSLFWRLLFVALLPLLGIGAADFMARR